MGGWWNGGSPSLLIEPVDVGASLLCHSTAKVRMNIRGRRGVYRINAFTALLG